MAYKVPFVDYPKHYRSTESEIDAAIKEVFLGGDFILREHLRRFESNVASYLGMTHAIGVNSGTDALYLSLLAAGIGPGDEVITVSHTFLATVGAIVNCGARPILVDVGKDYNMDVNLIEAVITPQTRAIIPVHLNGRLCDMDRIMTIAEKHNLIVVEDAAQALGATFDGKKAGSFGLTGCFSFYPAKILGTAGDGGLVATNDEEIARRLRGLRDNGRVDWQSEVIGYGFNSRLDNLHAAILNVKLKFVPQWITRRRKIAALYHNGLSDLPELKTPPPPETDGHYYDAFQNYVVRTKRSDALVRHLMENGVEILISFPIPMHHQKALDLAHFKLPETEAISRETLSLPMYPELSDDNVSYVIEVTRGFFK
ncbi:DegT/DnrJ/EryC1/StrS family aminotransferase [Chloroflexota bacterium]